MKRLMLPILYSLISIPLMAQQLSEQEIIQKMQAAAQNIKTVQCNFTQTKHMKMLAGEQVSQGRMYCRLPDKLRWEYTSPQTSAIIMDGTDVRMSKGNEENASRSKFIGEMARLIMNSVAGKCLTDSKAFQVSAREFPAEYVANLFPLRKEIKRLYSRLILHFDIRQGTVTQVELHEKNGDQTIIELNDIRINK